MILFLGKKSPPTLGEWLKYELNDKPKGLWAKAILNNYEKAFGEKLSVLELITKISSLPFIKYLE